MSSPCRASLAGVVALLALLGGCSREKRDYSGTLMQSHDRSAAYLGNAQHISEGQRLFVWMNCAGCHSHGGGGMGPALMDDRWIYGSDDASVFETIAPDQPPTPAKIATYCRPSGPR